MAVSGSDIANFAQQYLGTPYVWGGNSLTSGVDCSGLVLQVYSHFGLSVPRTTYQQIGVGKAINMNQLQAGDMVFFDTNPSIKGPDHVGLYIANVSAARIQVQDLASQMGAAISVKQLDSIADQVVTTGLNEEGLRNVLGQYIKFGKSGNLNGDAGTYENNIKQVAYNQGVTLSDQTIKNQAALIGRGLATQKDFENQIQQQAASAYPAYKNQLAAGSTMMDIAQPYIQSMSQGLEIPAQGIGLTDPLVKQALNGLDDKGQPTGMDQVDFQSLVRNDPRWKATQNAQDSLMSAGTKVLTDMGLIAKG